MAAATDRTASRFRGMARHEIAGLSPLYERLTMAAAARPEILDIMQVVPDQLRGPTSLLAAIQFLLTRDGDAGTGLAGFFPNLTTGVLTAGSPGPALLAFCRKRRSDLQRLVRDRRVQTNEVWRASSILLTLRQVERTGPLSLVELGCSAGLNLFPDRYRYRYGDAPEIGEPDSPILLSGEYRGETKPPVPSTLPRVDRRIGIDRSPIDLDADDEFAWLVACVWPEHEERRRRLATARDHVRRARRELRTGGIEAVGPALAEAAGGGAPVLVTSHRVTYFSAAERQRLAEMVHGVAREFDLDWVILEGPRVVADLTGLADHPRFEWDRESGFVLLALVSYREGRRTERLLARCHNHAEWIEWLGG